MTANEAHRPDNKNKVKTNLEAIRKMNNPQPTINVGDEVRVMVKKKFHKNYTPDWSDKTYKVDRKQEWMEPPLLVRRRASGSPNDVQSQGPAPPSVKLQATFYAS